MQEVISGPGLKLMDNDEYRESVCGVYPDGLFRIRSVSSETPFSVMIKGMFKLLYRSLNDQMEEKTLKEIVDKPILFPG